MKRTCTNPACATKRIPVETAVPACVVCGEPLWPPYTSLADAFDRLTPGGLFIPEDAA